MFWRKDKQFRMNILRKISQALAFEYTPKTDTIRYEHIEADGCLVNLKVEGYLKNKGYRNRIHPDLLANFEESFSKVLDKKNRVQLEILTKCNKSEYRWHSVVLQSETNTQGEVIKVLGCSFDIHKIVTERNLAVKKAATDMMTGIYNKPALLEKIEERLAVDGGAQCAMLMIDLDDFKNINDVFGHVAGDKAIQLVVLLLQRTFDSDDLIGRFGGDEFILFMQTVTPEIVKKKVEKFRKLLANSQGDDFTLTCSIGILYLDGTEKSLNTLLSKVDEAMYQNKNNGKDGYHIWTEGE